MFTLLPSISLALMLLGGVVFIYGLVDLMKRKRFRKFFIGLAFGLIGWIGLTIAHSASAGV